MRRVHLAGELNGKAVDSSCLTADVLNLELNIFVRQLRYWQSLKIGILADPQMAMSGFWLNRGAGNVRIYLSKI